MVIIKSKTDEFISEQGTCITVGTFDGIHRGHDAILYFLKNISHKDQLKSLIFTFDEHPRYVLKKDENSLKLLNTAAEKAEILSRKNIDYLYIQEFNADFYNLDAELFIEKILIKKLKMKALVIGHDHLFGKGGKGNFNVLKKLGERHKFNVYQLPPVSDSGFAISSTKIRRLLSLGDLSPANEMLGYHYTLTGTVIHGRGIGKTIGFPTANIKVNHTRKLIPASGVYIINAITEDETFQGILNIGIRPTFNEYEQSIEAHLFDFHGNLYNKELKIEFLLKIRDEIKFENIEDLQKEIEKDKYKALHYFKRVC